VLHGQASATTLTGPTLAQQVATLTAEKQALAEQVESQSQVTRIWEERAQNYAVLLSSAEADLAASREAQAQAERARDEWKASADAWRTLHENRLQYALEAIRECDEARARVGALETALKKIQRMSRRQAYDEAGRCADDALASASPLTPTTVCRCQHIRSLHGPPGQTACQVALCECAHFEATTPGRS
jgi:hypothetical protein